MKKDYITEGISLSSITAQVVNKIYYIRNQNVMLDSELAELYGVETKVLNQAIKRNFERFPEDFMFQLTDGEWQNLKSQIVTSSWGGKRKLPYVFTEYGILMLSSVLNSPKAIQMNIEIVRIFTRLKKMLSENQEIKLEVADIKEHLRNHDKNIELLFNYFDELTERKIEKRNVIGFKH